MKTFAYIATVALVSMVGIGTANAKSDIHVTINAGGVRAVVEAPAHERHPEVRTVVVTRPVVVGAGHTVYVAYMLRQRSLASITNITNIVNTAIIAISTWTTRFTSIIADETISIINFFYSNDSGRLPSYGWRPVSCFGRYAEKSFYKDDFRF